MKFFITTKKKVTTKSNGDGPQLGLPLPTPPPEHRTCNERQGYFLPVDITLLPLHTIPRLKQPSPRSELRVTSSQTVSAGENDGVPLSPKMVKVLGADGREEEKMVSYLKSKKKSMWGWPRVPSDSDLSNHSLNVSPRRDTTSAHVHHPQSSFSNRRGCNSSGLVMNFENVSVANGSANRSAAAANGFRAQECSTADWRTYHNCDDDNELGSSPSFQFSPSTTDLADGSSTGKASPAEVSRCSTPQRSPRKHLVSSQGKSFGPFHESCHKPCKLPSPPRSPHQLDRRSQTCSSKTATVLQDLASRPGSLPSLNHNREISPRRYKLTPPTSPRQHEHKPTPSASASSCPHKPTPPTSPRQHEHKPTPSASASSCPHKPTPPTSPRTLKVNPVMHLENQDYMPSPWNSPQRSIISVSTYQDTSGSTSPLHRFFQPIPKPPQRWKRGAKIGSGSFGCVYEGWNLDDGTFFAVKVSHSDHIPAEIHQEVAVLSKLRHPNIVQYYGTTTENGSICIFLELVKMGSLQSIMKNFQVFDEVLMSSYTRQILAGLEYLHAKNTVHRDIKCANILVDSDGQVKLADFGLAKQMKESLATSVKGSPYYMAPEVLSPGRNKRPYGLAVDIWSLGCTVLEMADGKPPWSGLQGYAFFFKVTNGELPAIPQHLSDIAKDFITQCLRKRPEDRPTVKELIVHPFVAHAPRTFRASVPARD